MADDLAERLRKALGGAQAPSPSTATLTRESPSSDPLDPYGSDKPEPEGKQSLELESALALEAIAAGMHRRKFPINEPVYDPSQKGRTSEGRVVGVTPAKDSTLPTPAGFDPNRWRDITRGHITPSSYDLTREIHEAHSNSLKDQGQLGTDAPSAAREFLVKDVLGGAGRGMEGLFSGAVGLGHAGFEAVQLAGQDIALESLPDNLQTKEMRSLFRERMGPVPAKALRERAFDVAGEALFGEKRAAHMAEQRVQTGDRPVPAKDPEAFINPTYKGFTLTPFATEATGGVLLEDSILGDMAVAASNIGPLALDIATPADVLAGPALKAGRAVRAMNDARMGIVDAAADLMGKPVKTSKGIELISGIRPDGKVLAGGEVIDLMPLNRFQVADDIRDEVMKLQAQGPSLLQRGDAAIDKIVGKVIGKTTDALSYITPEPIKRLGRLALLGRAGAVSEELGAAVNAHSAERRWGYAQALDKASRLKDAVKGMSPDELVEVTKYIGGETPALRGVDEAVSTASKGGADAPPAPVIGRHSAVADIPYEQLKAQLDETGSNALNDGYYIHASESPTLGASGINDQGAGIWLSHPSAVVVGGRPYLYAVDLSKVPEGSIAKSGTDRFYKSASPIPPDAVIPLGAVDPHAPMSSRDLHNRFIKSAEDAKLPPPETPPTALTREVPLPKPRFSPEVQAMADDIKEVIRTMRERGVREGTISPETFDEFINGYLVRVYEDTLEKTLAAGGKEGERLAARMDLPRIRKNGYGGVFNLEEDRLRVLIPEEDQQFLVYQPNSIKGRTLVKFEDSAEGSAALDRLLSRTTKDEVAFKFKPLSPEERLALNEVTDPVELVKMTMQKLGRENADAAFLNTIARNPKHALPQGSAPEGWIKVTDSRWGPLNGQYIDPDVHAVLSQKIETDRGFNNFVRGVVGAFRANMLFTPRTATRNMISNFLMYAPLNRVDPLDPKNWNLWGEAAGELSRWKATGQMSPDIAAMMRGGIEMEALSSREADFILDIERVGNDVHSGKHSAEVWGQRLMHYATGSPLIEESTKAGTAAARGGSGAVVRGGKALLEGKSAAEALGEAAVAGTANAAVIGPAMEVVQAAYNGGDKWLKVAAFKRWRQVGIESGLDAEKATLYAIQQTAKFTQNFSEIGGLASFLTGRGQSAGATLMKVAGFPFAPSFWDQHAKILGRSMKEQPVHTLAMMSRRYGIDAAAWAGIVGGGTMTQEQYTKWRRQNPEKVPIPGTDGKVYGWDDTYLFPGFPRTSESGLGTPNFEGVERSFGDPKGIPKNIMSASPGMQTVADASGLAKALDTGKTREAESLYNDIPLIRGEQTMAEGAAKTLMTGASSPMAPGYGRDITRIEETFTKKSRGRLPDEKGEQEAQNLPLTLLDSFLGVKLRETSGARTDASAAFDLKGKLGDARTSIRDAAKEARNYISSEEGERRLKRAGNTVYDRIAKALDDATEKGLPLKADEVEKLKASIRASLKTSVDEQIKQLKSR